MISGSFFKQLLIIVSLIACACSFISTGNHQAFASTATMYLINNIVSLVEKGSNAHDILYKVSYWVVRIEIILIAIIFLCVSTNYLNLAFLDTHKNDVVYVLKWIVTLLSFLSVVVLSLIIGRTDTLKEKNAQGKARGLIRESNNSYLESEEDRRKHYDIRRRQYIASNSHRRAKPREKK